MDRIAESLATNGQYRPIVVNLGRKTGRPLEILAGNHTFKAAKQLGWETITATTVDVDDQEAARIVAADNRTADLGGYDWQELAELLAPLPSLEGTGYTEDELAELIEENDDDPHDSNYEEQYASKWELVVECRDEQHQERLFNLLSERGETCRLLTL